MGKTKYTCKFCGGIIGHQQITNVVKSDTDCCGVIVKAGTYIYQNYSCMSCCFPYSEDDLANFDKYNPFNNIVKVGINLWMIKLQNKMG